MNRLLIGIGVGAGAAAVVAAGLVYFGLVHVGTMAGSMQTESAAMQMPAGAETSPIEGSEAAEHTGHDMPMPATQADAGAQPMAEMEGMEHAATDMASSTSPAESVDSTTMPADAVMITPERQQLIGIRTATVERQSLDRVIRTVGRVEYDERRVAHIHTKVTGWIEGLFVDFTGKLVEEGRPLLEIYSPELLATQEEYLLALRAQGSLGSSSFPEVSQSAANLLEATRRRLRLWDVTDEQIARLEETGEPHERMTLYSPIRGFVIHKGAYEGRFVGPQDELYTIADLREVWITADVYEYELPLVREGQPAKVTLPYFPGETFTGRVDYVYPYLQGETRTVKVRLVFSNPEWKLKPDMYANVELTARVGEGLLIPEDAVIDTGTRKVAFRVLPGGHFQPVEIETGIKVGANLQVLSGLEAGEQVVSGATFLVDSEAKLRSALRGMGGHVH